MPSSAALSVKRVSCLQHPSGAGLLAPHPNNNIELNDSTIIFFLIIKFVFFYPSLLPSDFLKILVTPSIPNEPKVIITNELKIVSSIVNVLPKKPVTKSANANNDMIANDAKPTTFFSLMSLLSLNMSLNAIISDYFFHYISVINLYISVSGLIYLNIRLLCIVFSIKIFNIF